MEVHLGKSGCIFSISSLAGLECHSEIKRTDPLHVFFNMENIAGVFAAVIYAYATLKQYLALVELNPPTEF